MLISLNVRNLAIIDEEEIEFGRGLNILSGETGAGKSIILGALGLAMGNKPIKGLIRNEEKEAFCEAVFSVNERQKALLSEIEIEAPDGEVILQRKITSQRAAAKINGESVPATKLAECASVLIDIYGQHDQQTLLSQKNHIKLLDEFGGEELKGVLEELSEAYTEYRGLKKEYEKLNSDVSERTREADLLAHEINEIESANPVPGEEEELREEYKKLTKTDRIKSKASEALGCLEGEVMDSVGRAIRLLREVEELDSSISEADALSDAESILSETVYSIKDYLSGLDLSGERMDEVGKRLDVIDLLLRKYSKSQTIEEVLKTLEDNRERLLKLQNFENYKSELELRLKEANNRLDDLCTKATKLREKAGAKLSEKVTLALFDLNFSGEGLTVKIEPSEDYTSIGKDRVVFYISTNPGEAARPLNDIASGGELSRIMLAIKTVFAGLGEIDTLVFDEIDTGVSGRTAARVAARLSSLSGDAQVICITHLPQIAACANKHFLIEKAVENGVTQSSIRPLDDDERLREVARMLAGDNITEAALKNAAELISGE